MKKLIIALLAVFMMGCAKQVVVLPDGTRIESETQFKNIGWIEWQSKDVSFIVEESKSHDITLTIPGGTTVTTVERKEK